MVEFEFLPVSSRMQSLRQRVRDRVIIYDGETERLFTEADKIYGPMLPYLKHGKMMRYVLERKTCKVFDDEMLVQNRGLYEFGGSGNPMWSAGGAGVRGVDFNGWQLQDDGFYHNAPTAECKLAISVEEYESCREINDYWIGGRKTLNDIIMPCLPDDFKEIMGLEASTGGDGMPIIMLPGGHQTPGYQYLVTKGYGAVRDEAQKWLDDHYNNLMGDDTDKHMFYTSVIDMCCGMEAITLNYAKACEDAAQACDDPARKAELLDMADGLRWISVNPARHYRDACQMVLIYIQMIWLDGVGDVSSIGRFDQYTWPFLEKDLESGYLTFEQAQEITDCFFLKVNSMYGGGEGKMAQAVGIGATYMHTTLGGVHPDTGEDATNLVTYMSLASLGRMKLHDPTTSLRINKNAPDKLWEVAIDVNKMVGGLPLFQNDEVIIPGLQKELGFSLEDARDYAIIGCQEITGSGNDYACCNGVIPPWSNVHYSVCLVMALNDGLNPFNNKQASCHTGYLYEMKDIEDVKAAWYKMADYVLHGLMSLNNYAEYVFQHFSPFIGISLFTKGCMESGMDCTWGGAKYNEYGGCATGLATIADSLSAIEYLCFDKKICTTRELYDALMDNWEGHEELQAKALNEVPHFGNADDYADRFMKFATDSYYKMCQGIHSKRAKIYRAGLYGASDHIVQGYCTWATPDGRVLGQPLADAASPAQGRDKNGPTAVLRSANCYDQGKFTDGLAVNLRIHPSAVNTTDGMNKLRDMTKTYMEDGGLEVQYNVVSSEALHAAQADPEKYRDLVVRIAGYSAYFVELAPDMQNDIISRTENSL